MIKIDKITIPTVPLFFRSLEKAAWERNHPWEFAQNTNYWSKFCFKTRFPFSALTKSLPAI